MRILTIFACLLALAGCTSVPRGVVPVSGFQADRYLGEWYAIARLDHIFERGLSDVSAVYSARPDGRIGVLNRGLDPKTCEWRAIEGSARFLGPQDVASLGVRFRGPIEGGYHVIALDPGYGWAMVSGPTRSFLWILARQPTLAPAILRALTDQARALGYPVEGLIIVDHGQSSCAAAPPPR